jgi:hypothetical protein
MRSHVPYRPGQRIDSQAFSFPSPYIPVSSKRGRQRQPPLSRYLLSHPWGPVHDDFPGFLGFPISRTNFFAIGFELIHQTLYVPARRSPREDTANHRCGWHGATWREHGEWPSPCQQSPLYKMTENKGNFLTLFRTVAASVRDAVNDCTSALSTLCLHSLTGHGGLANGPCFHRGARQVSG